MTKTLIAGESWISQSTHFKGFDAFTSVTFESGVEHLRDALQSGGGDVTYLPAHDVPRHFPTREELQAYDVVVLSDIGANSILLHPDTWVHGERTPNRLAGLADWVTLDGGGLVMAGGYLSFQGIEGKAAYRGTAVETVLPVSIEPWDDRVEVPQGVVPALVEAHPITAGLDTEWPFLLGYNRVVAKPGAQLLATIEGAPLLAAMEIGAGRSVAWTSDIAPHWCPLPFTRWPGYATLMRQIVEWAAGAGVGPATAGAAAVAGV